MTLRRLTTIIIAIAGALLLAVILYLAFGDLGRHKGRIESFVSERIGRPFAIDGALELQVLPSVSVLAERIRVGNAEWGSTPQMVEIGRFSTKIGLWSLVSGPVDVRSFELSDVTVVLENGPDGKGNWVLGDASAAGEGADSLGPDAAEVPAVIQDGKLHNLRITYREGKKKPDRVVLLETLTIGPGSSGLLAISGKGKLDNYATTLTGELGPLTALTSGRDVRMAIQAAVGNLGLDVNGGIGRLNPLQGADLRLKIVNPDLGTMLKNLHLPVFATGALSVDARLSDAGELTRLDLDAKLGDITAKVSGTLRTLGLPGSDLKFEAAVADAARLAAAFDVTGLPAGRLEAGGRFASSRTAIKLDGISVNFAGVKAKADGTVRVARDPGAAIRFELAAESLARLREGLPAISFSMNGNYAGSRAKDELKDLKGRIGENEVSGQASMARTGTKHVEVELASPRLDLTPFLPQRKDGAAKTKSPPKEATKKFVFGEEPLPLDPLKGADARLHFTAAEVKLDAEVLKDVDGTLTVDRGRLAFEGRARDVIEGTLSASLTLAPAGDGAADLSVKVSARNVRPGFGAGGAIDLKQAPATSLEANLLARGGSAHQLAAGANGRVLLTQGPGKMESGLFARFGGDIVNQLAGKLNPFAAQDPYMQLDCTVARLDIVDGQATVKPMLIQSEKVTVVASGKIDLRTEALTFAFNTRPRRGIGISAGMFTNPFIELTGTLASPRVGVGAKGAASGTVAAATGGVSVLAQGLLDRALGQGDLCKETLEVATSTAK